MPCSSEDNLYASTNRGEDEHFGERTKTSHSYYFLGPCKALARTFTFWYIKSVYKNLRLRDCEGMWSLFYEFKTLELILSDY